MERLLWIMSQSWMSYYFCKICCLTCVLLWQYRVQTWQIHFNDSQGLAMIIFTCSEWNYYHPIKGINVQNKMCWWIWKFPAVSLENDSIKMSIVYDKIGVIHGEWSSILTKEIGYREVGNSSFIIQAIAPCILPDLPLVI